MVQVPRAHVDNLTICLFSPIYSLKHQDIQYTETQNKAKQQIFTFNKIIRFWHFLFNKSLTWLSEYLLISYAIDLRINHLTIKPILSIPNFYQ